MSKTSEKIRMLTSMGILTAIVVVLQSVASVIRLGMFSIALVFIPIVVGAALYGWKAGTWLGFVFSVVVMFTDTALFMAVNPFGTIVTVILKGTLAGLLAAVVYKALEKKNGWLAIILSAIVCQVVNKVIFLLGCGIFFFPMVQEWAAGAGFGNAVLYLIFGMTGLNSVVELAVNLCLSTVIVRVLEAVRTRGSKRTPSAAE